MKNIKRQTVKSKLQGISFPHDIEITRGAPDYSRRWVLDGLKPRIKQAASSVGWSQLQ